MKARTVQQLFNVIIAAGYYDDGSEYDASMRLFRVSGWMCVAVRAAKRAELITPDEADKVYRVIDQYLMHLYGAKGTLSAALHYNDLPSEFNDRLVIYRDWKNRPRKVNCRLHRCCG